MSNKCQFSNLILPNDPLYAVAAGKYIVEIECIIRETVPVFFLVNINIGDILPGINNVIVNGCIRCSS